MTSKRTKLVRELISEVVGLSPYERRLLDMLKTGGASSEKRMYKFAKRRVSFADLSLPLYCLPILFCNLQLGTHRRALKKRDQIKETYSKIRARGG